METKELVAIDKIDATLLVELQGWTVKQNELVKSNPFIPITDNSSYEEAKKHRTSLLKGRTEIEKQDRLIASKLREFRSKVSLVSEELIKITLPFEEKQQEEVKRCESVKAQEKAEKLRLEEERKQKIRDSINSIFNYWKEVIKESTFQSFTQDKQLFYEKVESADTDKFEEFELDYSEKVQLLKNMFSEKWEQLEHSENQRLEDERLKKEKAEFKQQQEEARIKSNKEKRDRKIREEKEREKKDAIDAENKKRENKLAERERKVKEESDRIEKEKKEASDKKEAEQKIEAEKKEKALKLKRIKALRPDVEKLTSAINSIQIPASEIPQIKDKNAKKFLVNIQLQLSELKENLLAELGTLK